MKTLKKLFSITPFKLSFLITVFFVGMSWIYDLNPKSVPLIASLADKSLDYKFSLRKSVPVQNKIVIVAADNKSFDTLGQWPFDRGSVFSPLVDKVCSYNPKVVGMDIVWSENEKQIPLALKQSLVSKGAIKSEVLESILNESAGDNKLKKSFEDCRKKIVLGYALDTSPLDESVATEFEARMQVLLDKTNNNLLSAEKGKVVYPSLEGDDNTNVSFRFIANSGILNSLLITPPTIAQGFFNNSRDDDGNYRRAQFFYRIGNVFVSSLALRMGQRTFTKEDSPGFLMISPDAPEQGIDPELTLEMSSEKGQIKVPLDLYGQAITNFRGPNNSFPHLSIADILDSSPDIEYDQALPDGTYVRVKKSKAEVFKDAYVIFGVTAQAMYDIRPRPLDPQAFGVENHANILDNLLAGDFIVRPTKSLLTWLLIAIFFLSLLYGYGISSLNAKLGFIFAVTIIAGLLWFDQVYLFNERRIFFSGHLQAVQFLFQFIAITVLKYIQEEDDKKFIRSAFDKYVSPAIVDSMLKDPSKLKLGGDKKELSVLFSDIRGFTELSEKVDVKTLTQFLNEYLGSMTDILQKHSGTLDKFIGDAVMGFWGAPVDLKNHAELSTKAAVEMMEKLEELNEGFQKKYGFTIDIGIGINSGPVSVGNFGSNKVFEFTVIGDNVNLASRLEGINKFYGTHIIISEATYNEIDKSKFLTREIDTVKVKGKHKPVKIYEVFPDNKSHQNLKHALPQFNEALKNYYSKNWDQAFQFFSEVLKLRTDDKPSLELLSRIEYYKQNPPPQEWDGSYEMKSK